LILCQTTNVLRGTGHHLGGPWESCFSQVTLYGIRGGGKKRGGYQRQNNWGWGGKGNKKGPSFPGEPRWEKTGGEQGNSVVVGKPRTGPESRGPPKRVWW